MSSKLTFIVCLKMMQRHACRVAFVFALVRRDWTRRSVRSGNSSWSLRAAAGVCGRRRSKKSWACRQDQPR